MAECRLQIDTNLQSISNLQSAICNLQSHRFGYASQPAAQTTHEGCGLSQSNQL
jgi:hypothetical protein